MRCAGVTLICLLLLALTASPRDARAGDAPRVVVSIKPLHSLVAAVMAGIGEPRLIVSASRSPHDYVLKPSDARALEQAEIVFWIGPELERFLERTIDNLAGRARSVVLADAVGLTRLRLRAAGVFEAHLADHDKSAVREAGRDHVHGVHDMHLWLDPLNARVLAAVIAQNLAAVDPDNASAYAANTAALEGRLTGLIDEVAAELAPVRDRPFVVFHDAYGYFENRFGLRAAAAVTVTPGIMPGAARVRGISRKVKQLGAVCIFAEPQFDSRLIDLVVRDSTATAGMLDPLGAALDEGPDLYFRLIREMAGTIKSCLAQGR